jgi:hypothetical protein
MRDLYYMLWSFYHIALLLGAIFSGSYFFLNRSYPEYRKVNAIVFIILLVAILSEIFWHLMPKTVDSKYVHYNLLFVYLKILVMLGLFHQLPFSCQLQKRVLPTTAVFLVVGVIISLFVQPLETGVQSYTYLVGHGLILFFCIIFFKDILKQNRYQEVNLLSLPYFWIASWILFSFGESYIFFILSYSFPEIGNYGVGQAVHWVQFFAGLMYLSLGLAFYAPFIFSKNYSF